MLGLGCCAQAFLWLWRAGATLKLRCAGFLLWCLLLWPSSATIDVAHGLSWSSACSIFLDQTPNRCLLHWQVDSFSVSEPPGKPQCLTPFCIVTATLIQVSVCIGVCSFLLLHGHQIPRCLYPFYCWGTLGLFPAFRSLGLRLWWTF